MSSATYGYWGVQMATKRTGFVVESGDQTILNENSREIAFDYKFKSKFVVQPEVIVGVSKFQIAQNGPNVSLGRVILDVRMDGFTARLVTDDPIMAGLLYNATFVYAASGLISES
jgi:hypothetical protein